MQSNLVREGEAATGGRGAAVVSVPSKKGCCRGLRERRKEAFGLGNER